MSITSAIETTDDKGRICLGLLNRSDTPVVMLGNDTECNTIKNETILASVRNGQAPNTVPGFFWFPTPENCQNPDSLARIEKKIYESSVKFREQERLNTENSPEQDKQFLQMFSWDKSIIAASERSQIDALLKKFHTIFAGHRLDVGRYDDFKFLLTSDHDKPVCSQNPTTPIHIRDELLTELALLQYYGIMRTLPFSKYSSPIFVQWKPSGKQTPNRFKENQSPSIRL